MTRVDWLIRPVAHRGLHNANEGIIENTATAFQAAIDAGYAIECDIQASADGEAVVFHDDALERLTTSRGPVAERTAAALGKAAFRNSRDSIQTLPELLEQVGGRVPLVIEIKTAWRGHGPLEERVASHLRGYDGKAAVMSFDPYSMGAFAEIAPGIPRGLVSCRFDDAGEWDELSRVQRFRMRHLLSATIARPDFIAYDIKALPALAPVLGRNLAGWPLLTWTVRTRADRERAKRWTDAMIFEGFRPQP